MRRWPRGKVIDPITREIEREHAVTTLVNRAQRIMGPKINGRAAINIGMEWINEMLHKRGACLPEDFDHRLDVIASIMSGRDNILNAKKEGEKYVVLLSYDYAIEGN